MPLRQDDVAYLQTQATSGLNDSNRAVDKRRGGRLDNKRLYYNTSTGNINNRQPKDSATIHHTLGKYSVLRRQGHLRIER